MPPRIGIVSDFDPERQIYFCRPAYVEAIEAAGGLPILLAYIASTGQLSELLRNLDGVLLSGGSDIDPALYGEPGHSGAESVIAARDAFEMSLIRAVLADDRPLLGICRGLQSLNVAVGGSLYPDLASRRSASSNHRDGTPLTQPAHAVEIERGTRLAAVCGAGVVQVNSHHHQAIRDVGQGFRVSAYAPDGVVEAMESAQHRFAIGVQWHPERLWRTEPACRRLFEAFVKACIARRASPETQRPKPDTP